VTHSLAESLGGGSPLSWAHDWLVVAGFPTSSPNLRVVVAWEYAESGGGGGMWNPLNTTQPWPNSTNANSVGVKNYASRADGLGANAHVIHNGLYGPVVAAFDRGTDAAATVAAIVTSPWGTRRIDLGTAPPDPLPPAPPPPMKRRVMPCIESNGHGGYWVVHKDGAVFAFGGANYYGGANGHLPPGHEIVDVASAADGRGYWLLSNKGNVYAYGTAHYAGGAPVVD
jgi:hypothetical protein